ncbi:MAG TPA: tetratricopeptide repeat protein [Planctomycetota bacterium]|jgi:predicted regulator of Ras-like GTPase activity (Roadblock/LC7/MglB family)
MAFFDFFNKWRSNQKIKSLESALAVRPTPLLYLQLADAHRELGNTAKAAQVLKLGAARFPSAPEILRRQAEAEKIERENEKRRLVEKIQTHPNPILYARLAELYKADGEIEKTLETCQRGVKVFPKYGGTYLVLGQIYVEKKQWQQAATELEKSVELDKYNYLALKLLAQVYLEMNRPADAVHRLEAILYFAPGDEAILELLKNAKERAGVPVETKPAEESRPVSRGATATRITKLPERKGEAAQRDKVLNNGIAALRQVAGVTGAILVDQYGLVMAADLDTSIDEGLAGALITNVYRTTSASSPKMGVGQFEEGLIEGATGNIHIVQLEQMILAVFARADVKMGLLEKSIRDFAMTVMQPH